MRSEKQLRAIFAKVREMYGSNKTARMLGQARRGLTHRKVVRGLHKQGVATKAPVAFKKIRGGFQMTFYKSAYDKYKKREPT